MNLDTETAYSRLTSMIRDTDVDLCNSGYEEAGNAGDVLALLLRACLTPSTRAIFNAILSAHFHLYTEELEL